MEEKKAKKIIELCAECSVNSNIIFDSTMNDNDSESFNVNKTITLRDLEGKI